MAFIKIISPQSATGNLNKLYSSVSGPDGQVDQVLQVHSLRPHTLTGHMALYKAVLHHRSNVLPLWLLESIGVLVSRANGCAYCDAHHTAGLARLLAEAGLNSAGYLAALDRSEVGPPFSVQEITALLYARKLTKSPEHIASSDIESLREQGFSDGEILEINQVAAYFAYANRTVSGLGVDTEGETLGLAPDNSDEGWNHQ